MSDVNKFIDFLRPLPDDDKVTNLKLTLRVISIQWSHVEDIIDCFNNKLWAFEVIIPFISPRIICNDVIKFISKFNTHDIHNIFDMLLRFVPSLDQDFIFKLFYDSNICDKFFVITHIFNKIKKFDSDNIYFILSNFDKFDQRYKILELAATRFVQIEMSALIMILINECATNICDLDIQRYKIVQLFHQFGGCDEINIVFTLNLFKSPMLQSDVVKYLLNNHDTISPEPMLYIIKNLNITSKMYVLRGNLDKLIVKPDSVALFLDCMNNYHNKIVLLKMFSVKKLCYNVTTFFQILRRFEKIERSDVCNIIKYVSINDDDVETFYSKLCELVSCDAFELLDVNHVSELKEYLFINVTFSNNKHDSWKLATNVREYTSVSGYMMKTYTNLTQFDECTIFTNLTMAFSYLHKMYGFKNGEIYNGGSKLPDKYNKLNLIGCEIDEHECYTYLTLYFNDDETYKMTFNNLIHVVEYLHVI